MLKNKKKFIYVLARICIIEVLTGALRANAL